jgi:hypothetical protein
MVDEHQHEERQERLLRELLKIETHEDRMIAAMVQLGASYGMLSKKRGND